MNGFMRFITDPQNLLSVGVGVAGGGGVLVAVGQLMSAADVGASPPESLWNGFQHPAHSTTSSSNPIQVKKRCLSVKVRRFSMVISGSCGNPSC